MGSLSEVLSAEQHQGKERYRSSFMLIMLYVKCSQAFPNGDPPSHTTET